MNFSKKLVSIFLAVIFTLGISIPVFADMQIGTLTIHNTKEGETYTLYRIFDLTYSSATDGSGDGNHAYTINNAFDGFFTEKKIGGFEGDTKDLQAIAYVESRENNLADFATELQQYIIAQSVVAAKIVAGQVDTTVVDGLEYGYYLLVPTDDLFADGLSALFALDTVKPDAEINNKSQYPTIEKAIVENGSDLEANTVAIGDTVNYKVTSSVPSLAGYASYTFNITDTFDMGLTFHDDVTIQLIKGESTKDLVEGVDFKVSQQGQIVTITFTNFIQYKSTAWQGADIVVAYSATVNDRAVVGTEGNDNTVTLTYSSNPAVLSETKTTTPEVVSSYITGIALHKVDGNGTPLTGAQFQLTGSKVNKVRVKGNRFMESEAGTYYKLADGTYTRTAPTTETETAYESITQKYAMEYVEEVQTKTENFIVNSYVDTDGKLVLEGLAEGEYQIKEVTAPTGYHVLAEPITVTITCEEPSAIVDGTEQCAWSVSVVNPNDENITPSVVDGIIALTVENQMGNALPFTGGTGTILFTAIGLLLMTGAVFAFVIGRKKKVEK